MLILPIIAYQAISLLGGSCDLMIFGFIYASIPTTPSVLLYAQQYGVNVKHTTIGMVLCTIIGAPMVTTSPNVSAWFRRVLHVLLPTFTHSHIRC